jgi:hypothetical protein
MESAATIVGSIVMVVGKFCSSLVLIDGFGCRLLVFGGGGNMLNGYYEQKK